jgi:hypothetical protein
MPAGSANSYRDGRLYPRDNVIVSIRGSLENLVRSGNVSADRAREILNALPAAATDRDDPTPKQRERRQPRQRRSLRRVD